MPKYPRAEQFGPNFVYPNEPVKIVLKNHISQIRARATYDVGELTDSLDSDQINKLIVISASARKLLYNLYNISVLYLVP